MGGGDQEEKKCVWEGGKPEREIEKLIFIKKCSRPLLGVNISGLSLLTFMNVNVYFHVLLEESVLPVSLKELAALMTMGRKQPLMEMAIISVVISPCSNKLSPRQLKPLSKTDKNLVLH